MKNGGKIHGHLVGKDEKHEDLVKMTSLQTQINTN